MKRTTIMLPDDMDERLRLEGRRRGVPVALVVREAVAQYLPSSAVTGRLSFFAVGEGEPSDASERVDELVSRSISERHAPPRGRRRSGSC